MESQYPLFSILMADQQKTVIFRFFFLVRSLELPCHWRKMNKAVFSFNDYTAVSHAVQPNEWSSWFLAYDEVFCKCVISNVNFE